MEFALLVQGETDRRFEKKMQEFPPEKFLINFYALCKEKMYNIFLNTTRLVS